MTIYELKEPAPRGDYTVVRACVADANPDPRKWVEAWPDESVDHLTQLYTETMPSGVKATVYGYL